MNGYSNSAGTHVRLPRMAYLLLAGVLVAGLALNPGLARVAHAAITVTSKGAMAQINAGGLPGTHIREFSTLWNKNDPNKGTIFFVDSSGDPVMVIKRATTTDAGLTWTAGADTGLTTPSGAAALNSQRNPVVRDFDQTGNLTGFFGTKQGVYAIGYTYNQHLFRAVSSNNGASWSGEALVTFGTGAFPSHTGLNGFIEVFKTSSGKLRGYTAMNNTNDSDPNPSGTHIVESTDGGATWSDLGNIIIGGRNNVVGANGPVFTFTDLADGQTKMGWFMFGEGATHRGVHLMISTDEGLTWTAHPALSFLDGTIRSGDANFISDSLVRLFYYRNTGTIPSDRQLWYEDFTLSGMSNITPNNLTTVCPTITLLPATLPNGTVGTAYNQTLTASGGTAPYTFGVTAGALPPGLTLDSTGQLHGTPTTAGTFNFTVTATDANGCTGSQAYAMTVSLLLSPATLPNGTVGTAYNQTLTASGGTAPYTFAVTAGTLPPGLTLSANGVLSGKPTAAGTFNFTVTATDANGNTGSQAYSLTIVKPAPVGGYLVPVNTVEFLAPWLGLAMLAVAGAAAAIRRFVR